MSEPGGFLRVGGEFQALRAILGYSAKPKVITRRGKKTPHVKQHGQREMVTLFEAVRADCYVLTANSDEDGTLPQYCVGYTLVLAPSRKVTND